MSSVEKKKSKKYRNLSRNHENEINGYYELKIVLNLERWWHTVRISSGVCVMLCRLVFLISSRRTFDLGFMMRTSQAGYSEYWPYSEFSGLISILVMSFRSLAPQRITILHTLPLANGKNDVGLTISPHDCTQILEAKSFVSLFEENELKHCRDAIIFHSFVRWWWWRWYHSSFLVGQIEQSGDDFDLISADWSFLAPLKQKDSALTSSNER